MEYTLHNFFRLRAARENDPITKAVYQKLRNDSRIHMVILEDAMKALGRRVPKRIMLEVVNLDMATMERGEASIEEVEDTLEDLEAVSARYFNIIADSFPDPSFSKLFRTIHEDEIVHRRLLDALKTRKKTLGYGPEISLR